MWRCPTCKSPDHLEVVIEMWAKLTQPKIEPEAFETESYGDMEWGENSVMRCINGECPAEGDTKIAGEFECGEGTQND